MVVVFFFSKSSNSDFKRRDPRGLPKNYGLRVTTPLRDFTAAREHRGRTPRRPVVVTLLNHEQKDLIPGGIVTAAPPSVNTMATIKPTVRRGGGGENAGINYHILIALIKIITSVLDTTSCAHRSSTDRSDADDAKPDRVSSISSIEWQCRAISYGACL